MKSIGVIPARGGSKGLQLKNIRHLNGRPLIHYTIQAALKSKIDKIIVSTDSEKIAKIANKYSVEVSMRPSELAKDETPILPVLKHTLKNVNNFDLVVLLQPTSPFRTSKQINEAIDSFLLYPSANNLVSVVEVYHNMNPFSIMNINNDGLLYNYIEQDELVLRRQDKPIFFARNGPAILIKKLEEIQSNSLYNGNTLPYKMDYISSIDIDSEDDLKIAEKLFSLSKNK